MTCETRKRSYTETVCQQGDREYIDDHRWMNVVRVLIGLDPIPTRRDRGRDVKGWQAPCLR